MAIGLMWNDQVVELSGVPEQDEATLNPFGLIGYALVAVTTVAATGRLVAYLTRGTLPEDDEVERIASEYLRTQSTWNGTSVTMMPGLNSSAQRSHTTVWLCKRLCHQLRGTNCGTTTVMSSYGWHRAATSSR
jgi:hypothetical protein